MTSQNEHSWFRKRFVAFRSGLLEEVEEERFQTHLSECDECRKAWDAYLEGEVPGETGARHIPSAMVARWDRASGTLRGLERAMVRQHLEHCGQCRQDLEVLGFDPVLPFVPELELQSQMLDAAREETPPKAEESAITRELEPPGGHVIRIVRQERPGGLAAWWNWAFAGWAVAATAAALLLFVGRDISRQPPPPFDMTALPFVQTGVARGDASTSKLEVTRDTRTILLGVSVPYGTPPGPGAVIDVYSPEKTRLASVQVRSNELRRAVVMVPVCSPTGFQPGVYRVAFLKGDPPTSSEAPRDTFFEVALAEH
ncbi:MAG: zf-HC2 domain-containing protein [Candidatus Eisenbacteria sp.]|nr:zf-HC2 domain-containing protein [Candidatus Eisenbacteria bacterium]